MVMRPNHTLDIPWNRAHFGALPACALTCCERAACSCVPCERRGVVHRQQPAHTLHGYG
jgi:hypothetical protein